MYSKSRFSLSVNRKIPVGVMPVRRGRGSHNLSLYPILTTSPAGKVVSSGSHNSERSYPLNASSRNSVASAVALSSVPRNWNDFDKRDVL